MAIPGIQLEMNFDSSRNRFKTNLNEGNFFVLFEANPPSRQADLDASKERLTELEFAVAGITSLPAGLAVTDRYTTVDTWNVADYASALSPSERDRHLVYLSGRGVSNEELMATAGLFNAAGFPNVVPVSGNSVPGENSKQTSARHFVESVHAIRNLKATYGNGMHLGCVVNPFKYNPIDLFWQYFKLIKKLNQGAEFLVTQLGWDMLKLQELRWYLEFRSQHVPSIARILMLTPEKVESICSGKYPGVNISPDFQIILQNELKYSFTQFEAAQWRRIQLQAAGCRLLGYSGIQLAGIERPDKIRIAAARISEALEEFKHFDDWKKAYLEYLARAEMSPYPYRFYLFNQLFSQAYAESEPRMNDASVPQTSWKERFYYKLCRFMFSHSDKQTASEHFMTKKLLVHCTGCKSCRLPQTCYICPNTCPKGMANGPCGGTKVDGKCEVGSFECIHSRRLRLAMWRSEIDALEENYIGSGE